MNPEYIPIDHITTLPPKIFKNQTFVLVPLKLQEGKEEKPIFIRFNNKKFKIFQHFHGNNKNFSLGLELVDSLASEKTKKDTFQPILLMTKKIQDLVADLQPLEGFDFHSSDVQLLKKDRSEKDKIFAKVEFKNGKLKIPF